MAMEGLSENILYKGCIITFLGFSGGSDGKEAACNVGDLGLISGLGRPPGGGHGHSNILVWRMPMVRGPWQATVHGVAKSQIRLRD